MTYPRMLQALAFSFLLSCSGSPQPVSPPAAGSVDRPAAAPSTPVLVAADDDEEPVPQELRGIPSAAPPPGENGVISLQALLPIPDPAPPPGFPSPTTTDKECARTIGLLGELDKDFAALGTSCGTGTGMKDYVKAVSGRFDASHKRDTFQIKLAGGYCYRFLAAADGSIAKLGFRVHRANGALHSVILGKQPVMIYRPSDAWCRRRDRDFQFVLETLDGGEGRYAFGVWARPNEKGRKK